MFDLLGKEIITILRLYDFLIRTYVQHLGMLVRTSSSPLKKDLDCYKNLCHNFGCVPHPPPRKRKLCFWRDCKTLKRFKPQTALTTFFYTIFKMVYPLVHVSVIFMCVGAILASTLCCRTPDVHCQYFNNGLTLCFKKECDSSISRSSNPGYSIKHETRPQGYKTFFILNSAEHEIYPAHKC